MVTSLILKTSNSYFLRQTSCYLKQNIWLSRQDIQQLYFRPKILLFYLVGAIIGLNSLRHLMTPCVKIEQSHFYGLPQCLLQLWREMYPCCWEPKSSTKSHYHKPHTRDWLWEMLEVAASALEEEAKNWAEGRLYIRFLGVGRVELPRVTWDWRNSVAWSARPP